MLYIHYLIPAVTVVICAFIQMRYISRTLQSRQNDYFDSARHINITIGMIAGLFLVCNATFSIIITFAACSVHVPPILVGFALYTLPLVNALFFPLILILRKRDLRAEFKKRVLKVLSVLYRVSGFRKIGRFFYSLYLKIQGYELLD